MMRLSLAVGIVFALGTVGAAGAADSGSIVVYAAASLREAFEGAAPAFTKKTGVPVTFSFGGSDMLVTQLRQGAPADVFASANEAQMKIAVDAGLTDGAPRTFARNRLVVIVPRANPAKIADVDDLAKPGVKLVLAAPPVPVGKYARIAFQNAAGHGGNPADFGARIERNVVSNELDVKAVAAKVSLGEADAGVVYATDVTPAIATTVKTIAFPPGVAPEATYPIVALKHAANASGGRAFVEFVLSPEGQAYLRARGFAAP